MRRSSVFIEQNGPVFNVGVTAGLRSRCVTVEIYPQYEVVDMILKNFLDGSRALAAR
jgi:hypothetical protein